VEDQASDLLPALQKLTTHLNALPQILVTKLYKPIAMQITDTFLMKSVLLTRHRRTSFQAGARIKSDIALWSHVCRDGVGVVRGTARVWSRLQEVGDVIGMEDEMVGVAEDIIFGDAGMSEDEDVWKSEMKEKVGIIIEETDRETMRDLLRSRDVTRY
jgi:hypothetical protein